MPVEEKPALVDVKTDKGHILTNEKGQYVYIGPDGENVNNAIEADRESKRAHTSILKKRAQKPVAVDMQDEAYPLGKAGAHTARLIAEAVGVTEARKSEGRS